MKIHPTRIEYDTEPLLEENIEQDPVAQFEQWFKQAQEASIMDPTSVFLGTSTPEGKPSVRTVLMKDYDNQGFVFYTNYQSRKAQELEANPNACLLFYWDVLHKQVRIEGKVERVPPAESDEYFQSRPKGSKIGALVSPQSQVVENRQILDERMKELEEKYQDEEVPRPAHWGGYLLKPNYIEFWQGRPNRLHDRIAYERQDDGQWKTYRLAP